MTATGRFAPSPSGRIHLGNILCCLLAWLSARKKGGRVILRGEITDNRVVFEVQDFGCGIADIAQAMQPFFSTGNSAERSGMGFAVMQSFMDRILVHSHPGEGTTVRLEKTLALPDATA